MNNQPFLSGFPTQICGSARRRLQDVIAAKRRELRESSISTYAMQFSHILPADFLHGLSISRRIRHYCNVVVFWTWLAQIFEANASLSKAVREGAKGVVEFKHRAEKSAPEFTPPSLRLYRMAVEGRQVLRACCRTSASSRQSKSS